MDSEYARSLPTRLIQSNSNKLSNLNQFIVVQVKIFNMKITHIKFIIEQFKNFNTKETQIKIVVFIYNKSN